MSHCPSCGQFVGPHDTCPHCGARTGDRMPIRAIKIAAVSVTAVGLLLLWLLAIRADPPVVPIGQIGATMNLAYVRLEGQVTRGPSYDPDTHYLSFWLADDTGGGETGTAPISVTWNSGTVLQTVTTNKHYLIVTPYTGVADVSVNYSGSRIWYWAVCRQGRVYYSSQLYFS